MTQEINVQKLNIHVLSYGDYYINCFLKYLSPSLLSNFVEGNEFESAFNLHISTTLKESKIIVNNPIFKKLKEKFDIHFDYIEESLLNSSNPWKHRMIMSAAHAKILKKAFGDGEILSYLMADCIVSNNYLQEVFSLKFKTVKLLLAPAVRLSYLDELQTALATSTLEDEKHFDVYSPRNLVRVAFESLHDEARCFFFHSRDFLNYQNYIYPTTVFFRNIHQYNSLVGFGQSWFIVGINTSFLSQKEIKNSCRVLVHEAYDVSFVKELCSGKLDLIEFIDDSDRFFLVSWDELNTRDIDRKRILKMSSETKIDIIEWGMRSGVYDNFRLKCFNIPFYWHLDDLDNSDRTALIAQNNKFGIPDSFISRFIQSDNSLLLKKSLFSYWRLNRKIELQIKSSHQSTNYVGSMMVKLMSPLQLLYIRMSAALRYIKNSWLATLRYIKNSWLATLRYIKNSWLATLRYIKNSWLATLRYIKNSWLATLRFGRNMYYFNKKMDNGFNLSGGNRRMMLLRLFFIYYSGFFRKY